MPNNTRAVEAQLHAASNRSSKKIKDTDSIEAVVEVPGRGILRLSVQRGGGYSLRAYPETDTLEGVAADRNLIAVGVLGTKEVVSVVPE